MKSNLMGSGTRFRDLLGWWQSHSPLTGRYWRKEFFKGLLVVSRNATFHESKWVTVAYSTKILKTWHIAITRMK